MLVLLLTVFVVPAVAEEPAATNHVGMRGRLSQVVLPGSELEVVPIDDRKSPVMLSIDQVYPHGTMFRYDFVYQGLEPGTHDLTKWLRRKDGSPTEGLPPLTVRIDGLLPPGQVEPNAPPATAFARLGGYSTLLRLGFALWLTGAAFILLYGRKRRSAAHAGGDRPVTLADRLQPVVRRALAGDISHTEMADLERLLLAFWRRRLHLEHLPMAEATRQLREHPDAGPLIDRLEGWLHRPAAATPHADEELAALLRPYQSLPADALDQTPARLAVAT